MHWRSLLLPLLGALSCVLADPPAPPPGSPGYYHGNSTQRIQFDEKSLYIDGKRMFLYGGEFHPWRLPVPELWSDILLKMKAAGMNTVSIYVHWGLTEGKRGTLNWEHWRSIEKFYQVAQEVGIYVVSRPGPYINAETSGGGFPGWLTNEPAVARTNQTGYTDAWQLYIQQFSEITSRYQYPEGPVIAVQAENEFYTSGTVNPTASEYMELLVAKFRSSGIKKIPIMVNDVYPSGHFAPGTGTGEVDIYGFDSYPNGFNCAIPSVWNEVANYYTTGNNQVNPYGLLWMPEFQGGALDPWGGPGYQGCYELLGPQYVDVFYKNNIAAGSKAMTFYMFYGGTNFGNTAYPGVYFSYDFGAAIHETRAISPKYNEVKLQGLFYQSSPSLLNTTIIGVSNLSETVVTQLSDGKTVYYVVRQATNSKTTATQSSVTFNTTAGAFTKPITLDGRQSKIVVSEYLFGAKSVVRYSTAEILTQFIADGKDYIVLYVPSGQSFETLVRGPSVGTPIVTSTSSSSPIRATAKDSEITISGTLGETATHVVRWGNTVVIITDKITARDTYWNPRLDADAFDITPSEASVVIAGPSLVRSVSVSGTQGSQRLDILGDLPLDAGPITLLVFGAPSTIRSLSWNGTPLKTSFTSQTSLGVGISASIASATLSIPLPDLKELEWSTIDSLPERAAEFDDGDWILLTKKSNETARPKKPIAGETLLYVDEYGIHGGSFVYRGYFNGTATGAVLNIQNGAAPGYTAYLNGRFIASGTYPTGNQVNATLSFPEDSVSAERNVLVVVSDSSGVDTDWDSNDGHKSPRGIQGYQLITNSSATFDTWKLAGTLGGEDYPDKVRGPYNEGGFFVERIGGIYPGYDYSAWTAGSPYEGTTSAGVQAYRTSFDLDLPTGVDVTLGFKFEPIQKDNLPGYRAQIFVNGWNYARYISNVGPQTEFPVPEGILDLNGKNDVVVVVWALDQAGAKLDTLELIQMYAVRSGKERVGPVESPGWEELRG